MTSTSDLKRLLLQAGSKILETSEGSGTQPSAEVTPAQLIAAVNELFNHFEALDQKHGAKAIIKEYDISQMGEHAIDCLGELGLLADRLKLPKESSVMDDVALEVARWVIRHHGEIRSLETLVNALALKANNSSDNKVLSALFQVMNDVIEHTSQEIKSDLERTDLARPWRMLNFNFAIVATRTQNKELMSKAFDTLGRNLPEDCPQFFAEGLKQAQRPEYGPEIKTMMAEYFKKWAVRH